jgi:hypothetical protein
VPVYRKKEAIVSIYGIPPTKPQEQHIPSFNTTIVGVWPLKAMIISRHETVQYKKIERKKKRGMLS